MRLLAGGSSGNDRLVTLEYILLALIVGIVLVVGCTNLRTAFLVGQTVEPAVMTDEQDMVDPNLHSLGGG